jgi:hypothetical protein
MNARAAPVAIMTPAASTGAVSPALALPRRGQREAERDIAKRDARDPHWRTRLDVQRNHWGRARS